MENWELMIENHEHSACRCFFRLLGNHNSPSSILDWSKSKGSSDFVKMVGLLGIGLIE